VGRFLRHSVVLQLQMRLSREVMLRNEKMNKIVTLCSAARTGDIKTLQRASKTALNWSDDEAMTPAMWSGARGQLYALRVIVERGYVQMLSFSTL